MVDFFKVVSRVSDKNSGDLGHPVQYIGTGNTTGWYVNVATAATENTLYPRVLVLEQQVLEMPHPEHSSREDLIIEVLMTHCIE